MALKSLDQILHDLTVDYLKTVTPKTKKSQIVSELYEKTLQTIEVENVNRGKQKLPTPHTLHSSQIADILLHFHEIRLIDFIGTQSTTEKMTLALYQETGENKGLYSIDQETFRTLTRDYDYTLTNAKMQEVTNYLREKAPRVVPNINSDIIPVENGLFNFKTKELQPFDPNHIIMSKAKTKYVPNPTNPIIYNKEDNYTWDVETWMSELTDDPEIVDALWAIAAATLRPYKNWDKMALLYSEQGNNGKGTFCAMLRNLVGTQSVASIPLVDFSKEFGLERLIGINAVITDENPVGSFLERPDMLKAAITKDELTINRKHKANLSYRFNGFIIQCINDLPQVRDKSDSFYRRQLFIPMTKNFRGVEKKYIKHDYLQRQDVLEYVLHKLLYLNIEELPNPQASQELLNEYKTFNDPIRDFFEDIQERLVWDTVPFTFLYDLYKGWFELNAPSGRPTNSRVFTKDIKNIAISTDQWETGTYRVNQTMKSTPEPMIVHYNLTSWKNNNYTGLDIQKLALATFTSDTFKGLKRK